MYNYVVFDVETPNRANDRMSAIGITLINDGKIADEYYSPVDSETHFDYFNTQLTGINAKTVKGAPNFARLWQKIEPMMSSGILVAHHVIFDMSVLKRCLNGYGIAWKKSAKYLCTVQIGRQGNRDSAFKANQYTLTYITVGAIRSPRWTDIDLFSVNGTRPAVCR